MNIKRKKDHNDNFFYIKNKQVITDPIILERIKKLVIPPAWKHVRISSNPLDKVQCTGYDSKDRNSLKLIVPLPSLSAFAKAFCRTEFP